MKKLLSELVYRFSIRPRLTKLKRLLPEASIHPAGSRYVCCPPVLFTDVDFLVFSENPNTEMILLCHGYKQTPFMEYLGQSGDFFAYRKGKENLIVTSQRKYAETFHTATFLCKRFNVIYRSQRVFIHEALWGNINDGFASLGPELASLLLNFTGAHGHAFHKAFRAKHDLVV